MCRNFQALLCWRSGLPSRTGGEFALLDPNTHSFVAACPGVSGIVDVSGFVLSPFCKSGGEGARDHRTLDAAFASVPLRRRLEVLGEGVRVLHGGDLAKVTMLYHNAEGEAWSSCSSEITTTDGWAAALSAETAARRVQRAWRARKERNALGAVEAPVAAAEASTSSRATPLKLRMPGDFRGRARPATPGSAPSPVDVRDVAAGEATSGAEAESFRFQVTAGATATAAASTSTSTSMSTSTSTSTPTSTATSTRRRKRVDHATENADLVPELARGAGGSGGSGSGGGSRGRKKTRSRFSMRDSLEALDAADRALQLSSHSGEPSANSREGGGGGQELWPADASPYHNTDESGGVAVEAVGGGGGGGAGSSGSESDGANAMCRATDALIRETWPVLQRTRSLQAFPSPPDSPPFRGAPASFPTDGRGAEHHRGGRQRSGDATAAGFEQGLGDGGVGPRSRWEEEAVTITRGSSPVAYPSYPSSPSWKGDGDTGGRAVSQPARFCDYGFSVFAAGLLGIRGT